jgi:hypothetical protein
VLCAVSRDSTVRLSGASETKASEKELKNFASRKEEFFVALSRIIYRLRARDETRCV